MRRGYNQLWLEWTQRCDSKTIKIHLDCSKLVEGEWLQGRSADSKRLKIDHDLAQGRFSIHAVASVERKRGLIVCILQSDLHMPCRLRVWIWPKTVTEGQDQQYRWNQSGTASRAVIKGNMERQQLLRRTGKSSHYVRSVNVISGCGWWSCHSSILQVHHRAGKGPEITFERAATSIVGIDDPQHTVSVSINGLRVHDDPCQVYGLDPDRSRTVGHLWQASQCISLVRQK
jgi:hypothetical protein